MSVLIVDLGTGNLGSVRRSIEECGVIPVVSADPKSLEESDSIILPGVGVFAAGMHQLRSRGWVEPLRKAVIEQRIPLLGICLGMQLLADHGEEGGEVDGLRLIPGQVRSLIPEPGERVPHMGWNEVHQDSEDPLFDGIAMGSDFYFIHSYHFVPSHRTHVLATTPHGGSFVSAIRNEHVLGVQFHPEKSSRNGRCLLRNFLGS